MEINLVPIFFYDDGERAFAHVIVQPNDEEIIKVLLRALAERGQVDDDGIPAILAPSMWEVYDILTDVRAEVRNHFQATCSEAIERVYFSVVLFKEYEGGLLLCVNDIPRYFANVELRPIGAGDGIEGFTPTWHYWEHETTSDGYQHLEQDIIAHTKAELIHFIHRAAQLALDDLRGIVERETLAPFDYCYPLTVHGKGTAYAVVHTAQGTTSVYVPRDWTPQLAKFAITTRLRGEPMMMSTFSLPLEHVIQYLSELYQCSVEALPPRTWWY